VGRVAWLRVGFDAERCDHCGDCAVVCPEPQVIDFKSMSQRGFIASGDCMNCGRCLEVCPRDAYHFAARRTSGANHDLDDLDKGEKHATQNAA
jgi:ferredoxin-type protein NapH